MLAAIRRGEPAPAARSRGGALRGRRRGRVPESTSASGSRVRWHVNRGYLKKQILPHFSGRQNIADIDRNGRSRNWFASLRRRPGRGRPVDADPLRHHAGGGGAWAFRPEGSNPCKGFRRYRRNGRERFLSDGEIRRLSVALSAHEGRSPELAAIVRLLLLTGCRKGEILTLRRSDYRDGRLFLRDSKTGPRTVWLSAPARAILDRLEGKGRWMFPAPRAGGPRGKAWLDGFWRTLRAEAGLGDARLHDLRHTHASIALREGETVLAIGRLLGHASPETTLKYTHLTDAAIAAAAEKVGAVLEA